MKKHTAIILTLSLVLASQITPAFANAVVFESKLHTFGLENAPSLAMLATGDLTVNYDQRKVTMHAQPFYNCLPDQACPQLVFPRVDLELPILEIEPEKRGEVIITAKEDRRPVDGELQILKIIDRSQSLRESEAPTEAILQTAIVSRAMGGESKNTSYFGGSVLLETVSRP